VPGVKVIVKDIDKNTEKTFITNDSGVYDTGPLVPADQYLMTFTKEGFSSVQRGPMTLRSGVTGLNVQLAIGQATQQISIQEAGGPLLETTTAEISSVVPQETLKNLPQTGGIPDWQSFINDRQGAIVGKKLVTLYGFTPGQRVTLKSPIYNQSVEFIIRGVYTGSDEKTLYFHQDYINELLPDWAKDQASTFSILANSAEDVPRVGQAIDSLFANSDAPTKTESEREFALSFQTMMGGVKQFLYGIMAAITFSLLLVMGNTMAMTVRERTKEVGTLKAIGFQRGTITALFLGEALTLACIGAAIGVGAAALIFRSIDLSLYIPNFIAFVPTKETLAGAFVLSILVGLISVIYSAYRVSGLTIAEALRSTE